MLASWICIYFALSISKEADMQGTSGTLLQRYARKIKNAYSNQGANQLVVFV